MPDLWLSNVRTPCNLPLDCHLLSVARLAWVWRQQPCARVTLRGDDTLADDVLLIHRLCTIGVTGKEDRLEGRSVMGGLGDPRVRVCTGSSSKCQRAALPSPAGCSSDEHIE